MLKKFGNHVSALKQREHEVQERIAQLLGKPAPKANKISLEHEKAIREYKKAMKKPEKVENGIIDEKLIKLGNEILQRVVS